MSTLLDLRAFLVSPSALLYAGVCEQWGLDPAADEPDEVLAWALRTGLAARLWNERNKPTDEEQTGQDKMGSDLANIEQARRLGLGQGWM